ncbi:DUF1513 domain-containing protein [Loktanella sp. SALINAS62]|uniref:DUF1513 domain-containing protein n=1 Tax=Loktanella sp. SALINAS62 TaxID=2706124 RepID=UPI001B8C8FCE|nr:DUF1513 domain-containing protein [Loktanella sp. SALINAS62]MBS1302711.1 DUF1513 domain-containing protein [Loktanella sp. SALINAS62]
MQGRRSFLRGCGAALATCAAPTLTWADVGAPVLLAAARDRDDRFTLYGINRQLDICFRIPLPGRGHAAAAHPARPEAVAFARRPGTFALVIDCSAGVVRQRLDAPPGRHFYGHGAYIDDGAVLVTTENAFDTGKGQLGLWDTTAGYRRIGEIASGGIGPHEIVRLPGTQTLAVANGGIRTHPDRAREKLNLATMRPNLTYVNDGQLVAQVTLPRDLRQASIRHLSARADGAVAMAMQWQGPDDQVVPLLGIHRAGQAIDLRSADDTLQRRLDGYAGSVAWSGDGTRVAITSPRGGVAHIFGDDPAPTVLARSDVCGVAAFAGDFAFTDGLGGMLTPVGLRRMAVAWDNHLVPIV